MQSIKHIILFVFCALIVPLAYSQNNSATCKKYGYLSVPDELSSYCKSSFIEDINNKKISLEDLASTNESCWQVYSDRAENTLFNNPNGTANGDVLDFLEMIYVKEVKGNWLNVFSAIYDKDRHNIEYNKNRGWIKSKQLILTPYSLLNEKSSPKKAMVLISISNLNPQQVNAALLENKFYNKPSATSSNATGQNAKKFDIYFILKEEGGAILLSRTDKLTGSNKQLQSNVPGWIPTANLTFWDTRICLEPSSLTSAYSEYQDKPLPIFDSQSDLANFIKTQNYNKNDVFKKYTLKQQRPNSYEMRMPILNNLDAQSKEVVTIATIGNSNDNSFEERAKLDRKIQEAKSKLENVNVLFVIDATQSMTKYYEPVANSIVKIIENNELKNSTNNLRFGLVIYRDYADNNSVYEIEPLTTDYRKIINKVHTTRCFSADKDLPEAQYNAMERGIKEAGFDANQSNILVLIGDAGNHQPDPKGKNSNSIVNLLYQYQISLIAFQVMNGRDPSFMDFNSDAQDYLRNTAEKYINKSNVKLENVSVKNTFKLKFISGKTNENELYMFGRFTYASGNQAMPTSILEKNIVSSFNEYSDVVDNMKSVMEGMSNRNGVFTPEIIDLLKRKGFNDKDIDLLKQAGDITKSGFTSVNMYGKDNDCFVPVVFLSYDEKETMTDRLQRLVNKKGSTTEKKKRLKDSILDECQKMLGDPNQNNILDKTFDEIWDILLGVPFNGNSTVKKTKLRDLDKLKDETFDEFYSSFEIKAKKFATNQYKDSEFLLADQKFYWIPFKDIPGNE